MNEIKISQRGYVYDILKRYCIPECNSASTPLEPNLKLTRATTEASPEEMKLPQLKLPYRELIGTLTYLALGTRPDICFAVSYLSQFNSCYRLVHWNAAKQVLKYLKGTVNFGITYRPEDKPIRGHVDADWGNSLDDRRSYSPYSFMLSGAPISWESKKQRTMALSSTEAEYMALKEAAKETIYWKSLLKILRFMPVSSTLTFVITLCAKR